MKLTCIQVAHIWRALEWTTRTYNTNTISDQQQICLFGYLSISNLISFQFTF